MKKLFGIVHCIGRCEDCSWKTESYKNGQAISARHAKHYKHKVHVETGMCGYYDGRDYSQKPR